MAKQVKNRWLGARVDETFDQTVDAYVEKSDSFDRADLVRVSVEDYMRRNPIKTPQEV